MVGLGVRRLREDIQENTNSQIEFFGENYDVEPFLLRLAELDLRVLVKELFIAGAHRVFWARRGLQHRLVLGRNHAHGFIILNSGESV